MIYEGMWENDLYHGAGQLNVYKDDKIVEKEG
jgi:hypothetical protein